MKDILPAFLLFALSGHLHAQPACLQNLCCCGAPVEVGIPNGNFEDPPFPPAVGRITFYAGESYSGWTVLSGSIDLLGPNYSNFKLGDPNGPSQHIDLNGFTAGTIATTLTGLMPGSMYTITLWYAKNPGGPSGNCNILIAGGAWLDENWTATNDGSVQWLEKCFSFTAQGATAELKFVDSSPMPTAGMLLDNISLWKCPMDNQPPTLLQNAQNETAPCPNATSGLLDQWLLIHGEAEAIDSCGPVVWTNNFSGDSLAPVIEVTFTATDACQNSVSTTAFFYQTGTTDTSYLSFTTCEPAQAGVFTQILSNQYGCDSVILTTFSLLTPIQVVIATSDYNGFGVSCAGKNDGSASITANGAGPFVFKWSDGSAGPELTNLSAGSYTVTVTDANGCTAIANTALDAPESLLLGISVEHPDCMGTADGALNIETTGGAGPYQYSIDGVSFQTSPVFGNLPPGAYTVFTTDANDCAQSGEASVNSSLPVQVTLGDDITIELGEQVTLEAVVSIPVDSLASVAWSIADSPDCAECLSQLLTPTHTNIYTILVVSSGGCMDTDTILVRVEPTRHIYVPNAFSPNGDGINDLLMIYSKPERVRRVNTFQIFDRWGDLLYRLDNFQQDDPDHGWDGAFHGKAMNPGVYVWLAEIEFIDGEKKVFSGDVVLVR